jgi:sialic acid synthase SpsE
MTTPRGTPPMKGLVIGDRAVGAGAPAYIIAEAGANHDRDLSVAHQLIDAAADAGCDAVKFQTYRAETLYSRFTPRFSEMDDFGRSPAGETPFQLIQRIELPREWQPELFAHAGDRGLDFLSTPFDLEAVRELADLGVKAFKVASYEIVYRALLKAAAAHQRPLIISTGNSSLADVEQAVATVRQAGNERILLLHCVSQYPARHEDVNLRAMQTLGQAFDVPVGFSDHTRDDVAAVVAVGLGACCLEKHFTLDRKRKGPDHPSAVEPQELRQYVQAIRSAERVLGSPVKRVQESEHENHRMARRSVHALVDIPQGTTITPQMLTVKRPALGIHPAMEDLVVGRSARRDIRADEWITWEMV